MMIEALGALVQEIGFAADLDQILHLLVTHVRRAMAVDACTVLLLEDGGYVLRATDGLNPQAVGQVRIATGLGLVGLVGERREPIALSDAGKHPAYLHSPLVRENRMHGFLGVPIIDYGRLLGVLTVQQRVKLVFDQEQQAFLITAAAAVASAIERASREVSVEAATFGATSSALLQGAPASSGVAIGTLVAAAGFDALEQVPDGAGLDAADEEQSLRRAVGEVITAIRARGAEMSKLLPTETHAIFEAHAMIAGDEQLCERAVNRIHAGQWAPAALRDTVEELAAELAAADDEYLRQRAEDVRPVGREILRRLQTRTLPARD